MMRGQTPPQAYAKEVLVQAYNWIQSQPDSVKVQAVSADALVSLFNRARRGGGADGMNAPVSSEKFRSELKDIATELKNFSDPELPPQVPPPRQLPLEVQRQFAQRPSMIEESREEMHSLHLDARTIEMLHKVKSHLNLSSDSEALRMLVVLGFERLQGLFR